ncbi:MAG TPA: hypothetical protein VED01_19030 [Burkholderiales bacterium]|nr:hypothetical protein [Burkholderiales bacterium]
MRKLLLLLIFLTFATEAALADTILNRPFPANGERGKLGVQQAYPDVVIGKQILRLTPGARIYDRNNRTILHAQLPPGSEVLYSRDAAGAIRVIYILTEQELARLKAAKP